MVCRSLVQLGESSPAVIKALEGLLDTAEAETWEREFARMVEAGLGPEEGAVPCTPHELLAMTRHWAPGDPPTGRGDEPTP
jgi:hypothetical protein